jgi:hypothetical protein
VLRSEDVRHGPEVLAGGAHREARLEAFAQQPAAAAFIAG